MEVEKELELETVVLLTTETEPVVQTHTALLVEVVERNTSVLVVEYSYGKLHPCRNSDIHSLDTLGLSPQTTCPNISDDLRWVGRYERDLESRIDTLPLVPPIG